MTINAADFPTMQAAINAAAGRRLTIPGGTYAVGALTGVSNIEIDTDGPVTLTTTAAAPILDFTGKSNFSIKGHLTLQGNGASYSGYGSGLSDTGQVGIKLQNADRYRIEGVEIKNISGCGILAKQSAGGWQHQGVVTGVRISHCQYGMRYTDSAEYETVSDFVVSNCTFGLLVEAGNNTFVNGKAIFCSIGVKLAAGANDAHGIFSGCEFNHNTYNLTCVGVTVGETFSGCHFLAGQGGGDHGTIQIIGSKGINLIGGQIGSDITVDATSMLSVQGNYIRPTLTNAPAVTSGGVLVSKNNFTDAGLWASNN